MDTKKVIRLTYLRFFIGIPVLGLFFFLPAGTFNYWEAWAYLALLFIPMFFMMRYLIHNDPALLERRMRMREKAPEQNLIIKISYIYYIVVFLLPGFDKRFGWSQIPTCAIILAEGLVLLSYLLIVWVFRTNSYASRTVEVDDDQKVIDTGPYAFVRHPMYTGVTVLYILSPLALGSYWVMIPALMIIPLLVARILSEEKILAKDLSGYIEYQQRVRYRLLPRLW